VNNYIHYCWVPFEYFPTGGSLGGTSFEIRDKLFGDCWELWISGSCRPIFLSRMMLTADNITRIVRAFTAFRVVPENNPVNEGEG